MAIKHGFALATSVAVPATTTAVSAYRLTLPYPPPTNRLYRRAGHTIHKLPAAVAFAREVAQIAQAAGVRPYAGEITLTIHVFRPQRSGDLDGRIKALLDSLQGHAYINDSQVVEIHAFRHDDKQNPRIEVEISEVAAASARLEAVK